MTEPTRFPLAWPPGRPRTKYRQNPKFRKQSDGGGMQDVTIAVARQRLQNEIERLGGQYPLLSSNIELRLDGQPRSDRPVPSDPGVCLYFTLKGKPFALACDRYNSVAGNIAALAAHIDATRAIERHGVASAEETLQAFTALPPPIVTPVRRPWPEVFGIQPEMADRESIEALFKVKARRAHPDAGGTAEAMAELNAAREDALRALGGQMEKTQ